MTAGRKARRERRARERAAVDRVRDRARLAALQAGGDPARPLPIATASLVEIEARAIPCIQCGGVVRVADHVVERTDRALLRVAQVVCTRCGWPRPIYFRIEEPS